MHWRIQTLKLLYFLMWLSKVEKIKEDSLDSIPSPSVKIQIMDGKVY